MYVLTKVSRAEGHGGPGDPRVTGLHIQDTPGCCLASLALEDCPAPLTGFSA